MQNIAVTTNGTASCSEDSNETDDDVVLLIGKVSVPFVVGDGGGVQNTIPLGVGARIGGVGVVLLVLVGIGASDGAVSFVVVGAGKNVGFMDGLLVFVLTTGAVVGVGIGAAVVVLTGVLPTGTAIHWGESYVAQIGVNVAYDAAVK